MRDGFLANERVQAIQEEVAVFLLEEVIAPTKNTIGNTILENRNRNYIVYMHERVRCTIM
jgi:hypothetical protein